MQSLLFYKISKKLCTVTLVIMVSYKHIYNTADFVLVRIYNHAYNWCEPPVNAHNHINFVETICTENQKHLINWNCPNKILHVHIQKILYSIYYVCRKKENSKYH